MLNLGTKNKFLITVLVAIASYGGHVKLAKGSSRSADAPKAKGIELKPKVACASLAGFKIPASSIGLPTGGATLSKAELKPASQPPGKPADAVPEYCAVEGSIAPVDPKAPDIHFRVVMPTVWNGKSWQVGGNQQDGFIPLLAVLARDSAGSPLGPVTPPDMPFPIAKGYALYGGDSGHCCAPRPGRRGPGNRFGLPFNNADVADIPANFGPPTPDWMTVEEASVNFGSAAIKKTHDAAMAVIVQMYGAKPRINYFSGESQGGREAMIAATRFPDDYDGVTSSVPTIYAVPNTFRGAIRVLAQAAPGGWIPPSKVPIIAKEVRRQCDGLDGLEDGVINNYIACNRLFDPVKHPDAFAKIRCAGGADTGDDCLSDAQIKTANVFHADYKMPFAFTTGETILTGAPAGGEDDKEGFNAWIVAAKQPDAASVAMASEGLKNTFNVPDFDVSGPDLSATIAAHKDAILHLSAIRDVQPDLSKFFAHGGKLILHSSSTDFIENPRAQMRYFETLVERNGRAAVDKSMRYYVSPNDDHSSVGFAYGNGDENPRHWDALQYIENWVEKGQAPPEPIVEMLKDYAPPYTLRKSRPLCRYPNYPRYNGSGDPKVAASYTCAVP